nr:hypothetical protein [Tanacetum cinerariifolium]
GYAPDQHRHDHAQTAADHEWQRNQREDHQRDSSAQRQLQMAGNAGRHQEVGEHADQAETEERQGDGPGAEARLLNQKRRDVGIRGKVRADDQPHQQNAALRGVLADRCGRQERSAPGKQRADERAKRHTKHGREGNAGEDDGGGFGGLVRGHQTSGRSDRDGPETAQRDAEQPAPQQ